MVILVGTSGWQYRDWRGKFYPPGVPVSRWLGFYADQFATVEVNNAFYRLPERSTFERWAAQTPDDFCVAVKASRYLTHLRRLREPEEPVARLLDRAAGLGRKLGPILLQLPPGLRADPELLDAALAAFPRRIRVAVEPRHRSWWTPEIQQVLQRRGAALCWADRDGRPVSPLWKTTNWGYLRLHHGRARPQPRYGTAALNSWLDRIESSVDGDWYVYFNNDPGAAATVNASWLVDAARRRGLPLARATTPRAAIRNFDRSARDHARSRSRAQRLPSSGRCLLPR